MKTNFIFLFFILILVNGVIATGFSPTKLVYELKENEEGCKTVTVNSESEKITVLDKWAENKDMEWKVSLFEEESSYHGISIDYQEELISEDKVEVCLEGSKSGEHHGVLLLREEQEGNSVVQMGVWLKATIEGKEVVESNPSSGSSGGGSSGGSSYTEVEEESKEEVKVEEKQVVENIQESIDENINEEENKITGKVVKENKTNFAWFAIPVALVILTVIIILIKKK
ncbi:hypothetical protein CL618_03765 [archaeon]|nr:hypothetical protein [archaeon]|tara:strand:+ start:2775 stop:3458 length:684 start_codon:yes stop_codon:yes gene_type:complete